jgi:hypothetical protein
VTPRSPAASPLPWLLAGGGTLLLAGGAAFFGIAAADGTAYNMLRGTELLRPGSVMADPVWMHLEQEGTAFRWVGLVGMIVGIPLIGTAVYFLARPPARSSRPARVTVGAAPTGLVLWGAF